MDVRSGNGSDSEGTGTPEGAATTATHPAGSTQDPAPATKPTRSTTSSLVELVLIIAVAGLLAVGIQAFIIKPYRIPSGSMEPTLAVGQRVLVNRVGMDLDGPHVGEIAVFHPPEGADDQVCGVARRTVVFGAAACSQTNPKQDTSVNFIKRIVAGPGDTLYVKEGHAYRNGVREKDSYIRGCGGVPECNFLTPIKIPAGHWFMMGDNRGESDDSRFWGPVPTNWIIGGAIATYWPPDRVGFF